jgi:outer membrane protein assembly factor BamB
LERALKSWPLTIVGVLVLTLVRVSGQENWPQFRGPNAGVIPDSPALPETWSATENVAWKTPLPGIAPDGTLQIPERVGIGGLSGPARGPAVHRQRQ